MTARDGYAFLATALGSSPTRGLGAPAPDTLEGVLTTQPSGLHTADPGYFSLHPEHLDGADGVLFLQKV